MFKTNFLTNDQATQLATEHATPLFVYSQAKILEIAQAFMAIPAPFGLTIRYAMKANPHPEVLRILREKGVKIDASSEFEAIEAVHAGYAPDDILLTGQQMPRDLKGLVEQGVHFNATSLNQLEAYGKLFPGTNITVRVNSGVGSGHSPRVKVGGRTSSFGIWHEYIPKIHQIAKRYKLTINRFHVHTGCGVDPHAWQEAARMTLHLIKQFPDATTVNLGGGFKAARMDDEKGADIPNIGELLKYELEEFAEGTGRKLNLELEPGTIMTANAGIMIARIDDIVDTGQDGYTFIKVDTGMNDFMRPAMYGSQHPLEVLSGAAEQKEYVVVGHNCESGDILTPAPDQPDIIQPRLLNKAAVGDLVLIGGVGAYCAQFSATAYNSFPSAKEVFV